MEIKKVPRMNVVGVSQTQSLSDVYPEPVEEVEPQVEPPKPTAKRGRPSKNE